jgi:hypothetical protein
MRQCVIAHREMCEGLTVMIINQVAQSSLFKIQKIMSERE